MPLIRNYGLFWRREYVFWGRPKVNGSLLGVPAKNRSADPVDFREQLGVYVLYDDGFHVVYVGQAGANGQATLFQRLNQHRSDALADRWQRFSWFGVRWVKGGDNTLAAPAEGAHTTVDDVLDHIEAILISAVEPPHNRQGGRFGESAEQYLQKRDERLGPTMEEMVLELWEAQRKP